MGKRATPRRFELSEGTSNKFWEVVVDGYNVTVTWGRIGAAGRTTTKAYAGADAARTEADKLVREKRRKGYAEIGGAPAPTGPMSEKVFWALIARLDWDLTGDDDAVVAPVVTALAAMAVKDIYKFDDLLAEKLYTLDTREICRGTYRGEHDPDDGDDYISADDFLYARCVIVANGKQSFDAALKRPMEVPQGLEFESLLYVAATAYQDKTGNEYNHSTPRSWESFSNAKGWKPTRATTRGRATGENVPPGNRRPS